MVQVIDPTYTEPQYKKKTSAMYVGITMKCMQKSNKNGKTMGLHPIKHLNEVSQHILCSFTNKTTNYQSKYSPQDNLQVDKRDTQTHRKIFTQYKPIGASPGRDYVLTRMVIQIIQYSTQYRMIHQKRGGTLHGLRIKREREEYVDILILRKLH